MKTWVLFLFITLFGFNAFCQFPLVTDAFAEKFEDEFMLKYRNTKYWDHLGIATVVYTVNSALNEGTFDNLNAARGHVEFLMDVVLNSHRSSGLWAEAVPGMSNVLLQTARIVAQDPKNGRERVIKMAARADHIIISATRSQFDAISYSNVFQALLDYPSERTDAELIQMMYECQFRNGRKTGWYTDYSEAETSALFLARMAGKSMAEAEALLVEADRIQSRGGGVSTDPERRGDIFATDLLVALVKTGMDSGSFLTLYKQIREHGLSNLRRNGGNTYLTGAEAAATMTRALGSLGARSVAAADLLPHVPVYNLNKLGCQLSISGPIPGGRGIVFGF